MTGAEEWRALPSDPRYQISSFGRVRGPKGIRKLYLSTVHKGGCTQHRYRITIGYGTRSVHQLVLEAFDQPRKPGQMCRHLDGNPLNNRVENLRWGTAKENSDDAAAHGTRVKPPIHRRGSNLRTWLNEEDVRCIRAEPSFVGVKKMLSTAFGVSEKTIQRIRNAA